MNSHEHGFTLIEMLVVGAILLTIAVLGFPGFTKMKKRMELTASAQEVQVHLIQARKEAMKTGFPVVVKVTPSTRDVLIFANVDQDMTLTFDPDPGVTPWTADEEIVQFSLLPERQVLFQGVASGSGDADSAVVGFEDDTHGDPVAVFDELGALTSPGSIRLTRDGVNVLELAVSRTGKIETRKWNTETETWAHSGHSASSGSSLWEWY